jgi:hypothetical protein
MEEQSPLLPADIKKRAELQQKLLDILDKEEKFWRQRARDNCLLQGDCNTAYFHRLVNGCKRKSTIFSLKNEESLIQAYKVMKICYIILQIFTETFLALWRTEVLD